MDIEKIRWEIVDWSRVGGDREKWCAVVNTVMNLRLTYE